MRRCRRISSVRRRRPSVIAASIWSATRPSTEQTELLSPRRRPGLHFTSEVLAAVCASHPLLEITLEVGEATFQKIEVEDIARHRMGSEKIRINSATARRIAELKEEGRKLLAVGTTSVRTLESFAMLPEPLVEFSSDIFISPGFQFRLVDKLLTNFHLPQSSLFILVSAFAGLDLMKRAYARAIEGEYRFFSYGDAMLII